MLAGRCRDRLARCRGGGRGQAAGDGQAVISVSDLSPITGRQIGVNDAHIYAQPASHKSMTSAHARAVGGITQPCRQIEFVIEKNVRVLARFSFI